MVGQALPNFFFALLLDHAVLDQLRWLPVSGSGTWLHFVMPTIALGYYVAPAFMRLIRAGMIEVLSADYIRTARAKGLPARTVVFKHALRNAMVPVVALTAVQLGFLLGGSVVIETIFALDGLGYLAYQSIPQGFPGDAGHRAAALGLLRPPDARGRCGERLARPAHPGGMNGRRGAPARRDRALAAGARFAAGSSARRAFVIGAASLLAICAIAVARAGCWRRTIPTPRTSHGA